MGDYKTLQKWYFKLIKVRKNAAIAVSKITQNSETAREEFRRLHGIEILTARLKDIKFWIYFLLILFF